jgi:hypothetical protein
MEIISMMRTAYGAGYWAGDALDEIWGAYWSGHGNLEVEVPTPDGKHRQRIASGEIWEYLIDGRLLREDRWREQRPLSRQT